MIEDVLFLCLSGKAKKLIHQLLRRNKFVSFGKKVEHFVSFPTHSDAAAPQTSGSPVRMGFHAFKLHRYASAQRNFYFSRAQEVNLVDCFGGIYHCQLNWPFQVQEVRSSSLIIFPAGESHAPAISLTNPPPNKKFQFNTDYVHVGFLERCLLWNRTLSSLFD